MNKQRIFNTKYCEYLQSCISENIPLYRQGRFDIDLTKTVFLEDVDEPESLAEKIKCIKRGPRAEYEAAVSLYEAYSGLSGQVSSDTAFWAYVNHTSMLPFLSKRLLDLKEVTEKDIRRLFFNNPDTRIIESYVPALYFLVKLSVDESKEDRYELTKILFSLPSSLRLSFFHHCILRNREALQGLLEYMKVHQEVREGVGSLDYTPNANIPMNKIKMIFESSLVGRDYTLFNKWDFYQLLEECLE